MKIFPGGAKGKADKIGLSLTYGACFIETNGVGSDAVSTYVSGFDPLPGVSHKIIFAVNKSKTG